MPTSPAISRITIPTRPSPTTPTNGIEWVDEFAGRSSRWIWYADCLDQRRPDLPLIVSEFGNWGLPDPDSLKEHGGDPWWFQTGHEWGEGIVHPHAMRQRFDYFGLGKVFGSFDQFITNSQEHMARSLHYEISSMRLRPEVGGYVITEFTDVHWECNGLLTMQREVKQTLDPIFTSINQDNVVVIRPQQWSGRPGERVRVELHAFGVDGLGMEGVIEWCAGSEQGRIPAPGGIVDVTLPGPGMVTVEAHWRSSDGTTIAANAVELACVQPTVSPLGLRVIDDRSLTLALEDLGYKVGNGSNGKSGTKNPIWITQRYTRRVQEAVQKGARVLLLADEDFAVSMKASQTTTASAYISPAASAANRNIRLPAGAIAARCEYALGRRLGDLLQLAQQERAVCGPARQAAARDGIRRYHARCRLRRPAGVGVCQPQLGRACPRLDPQACVPARNDAIRKWTISGHYV